MLTINRVFSLAVSLNGSKYKNKNIQDGISDYLHYQPWIKLFLEDGDQVGGTIETSAPAAAEMRGNTHGPASGNFIPPPRSAAGDGNKRTFEKFEVPQSRRRPLPEHSPG